MQRNIPKQTPNDDLFFITIIIIIIANVFVHIQIWKLFSIYIIYLLFVLNIFFFCCSNYNFLYLSHLYRGFHFVSSPSHRLDNAKCFVILDCFFSSSVFFFLSSCQPFLSLFSFCLFVFVFSFCSYLWFRQNYNFSCTALASHTYTRMLHSYSLHFHIIW